MVSKARQEREALLPDAFKARVAAFKSSGVSSFHAYECAARTFGFFTYASYLADLRRQSCKE